MNLPIVETIPAQPGWFMLSEPFINRDVEPVVVKLLKEPIIAWRITHYLLRPRKSPIATDYSYEEYNTHVDPITASGLGNTLNFQDPYGVITYNDIDFENKKEFIKYLLGE